MTRTRQSHKPSTRGAVSPPEEDSPAEDSQTASSVPQEQDHSVAEADKIQRQTAGAGDATSVEIPVPGPTNSTGQSPVSDRTATVSPAPDSVRTPRADSMAKEPLAAPQVERRMGPLPPLIADARVNKKTARPPQDFTLPPPASDPQVSASAPTGDTLLADDPQLSHLARCMNELAPRGRYAGRDATQVTRSRSLPRDVRLKDPRVPVAPVPTVAPTFVAAPPPQNVVSGAPWNQASSGQANVFTDGSNISVTPPGLSAPYSGFNPTVYPMQAAPPQAYGQWGPVPPVNTTGYTNQMSDPLTPPQPTTPSVHWPDSRSAGMLSPVRSGFTGSRINAGQRPNVSLWRLRFDGRNVGLDNYLAQLDCVAAAHGWDDTDKGTVLLSNLEGNASRVMNSIPAGCVSYTVIAQKLKQMFAPESNTVAYKAQFQCRMRGANETSHEYSLTLQDLATKAYPHTDLAFLDGLVLDQFIRGQPAYVRFALASGCHTRLERAVAAAIALEAYSKDTGATMPPQPGAARKPVAVNQLAGIPNPYDLSWQQEASTPEAETSTGDDLTESMMELLAQTVGIPFQAPPQCGATQQRQNTRPCYFCGKPGHFWMECRALLEKLRERGYRGSMPNSGKRPPANNDQNKSQGN